MSAVIIENEKKILISFMDMLKTHCPNVQVLGDAEGVQAARDIITKIKPDIVFLDIELSDGSAFELLPLLSADMGKDFSSLRIIFTTAFNHFALQAFRFSATDYLLKPIVPAELKEAVRKAEIQINSNDADSRYKILMDSISRKDKEKKICLPTLEELRVCQVSDIIRCEAQHNYTTFYFTNEKPLLISKTIKEYEDLLKDYGFERIHQSHLVNLKYINSVLKKDGGMVRLNDGMEIPIARRKKELLLERLKQM